MTLSSWLVHECTKKSRTGLGTKGDPEFGNATTFRARIEKTTRRIRFWNEQTKAAQFVMATDVEIKSDDVIWFPSIAGETADDTTVASAARSLILIESATSKPGALRLWQVYF